MSKQIDTNILVHVQTFSFCMQVLFLGNGGREHFTWHVKKRQKKSYK
jgi:hypothetical protein